MNRLRIQKGPGRPRKQNHATNARTRLIRAAAQLFAAQGFDSISMRTLRRAADVTPAMVGYYFNDKDGLLEAVLLDAIDKLYDTVERVFAKDDSSPFTETYTRHTQSLFENAAVPVKAS